MYDLGARNYGVSGRVSGHRFSAAGSRNASEMAIAMAETKPAEDPFGNAQSGQVRGLLKGIFL